MSAANQVSVSHAWLSLRHCFQDTTPTAGRQAGSAGVSHVMPGQQCIAHYCRNLRPQPRQGHLSTTDRAVARGLTTHFVPKRE